MALYLHRAGRTDLLAAALGALLADPPADPFAEELVLVPAHGVERWLSQRLAHVLGAGRGGDGVCAGVVFRSPGSLIAEITGTADSGLGDPWSPDPLTWPLLDVIDASCDEPWCRTLATHLGHYHTGTQAELRRGRRYPVARRLAGLFASYARQRPQLLIDWLDGRDTDGAGGTLDADLSWQPPLWRALVAVQKAEAGVDPPHIRHQQTVDRLRAAPTENLPARLSLFGHTRLAVTDIELLDALATHHELHLWLPHPSEALWQRLAGSHGPVPRSASTDSPEATHPLLETLGRDLRELQRALPAEAHTDEYLGGAGHSSTAETLLGWLQSDIAADEVRKDGRTFDPTDRSVQVHACHSPARQIDVLREVLLGLLSDDPTLQPRDIVVMCPDIETYAPLIAANFGLGELAGQAHPAHRLRVKLADRALSRTNPLLAVAAELLSVADSRGTASQVLNLAQAAPVRARFGFTDDDLAVITAWVREANIRWGFDTAQRAVFGLGDIWQNTWRFGLDRILTGVSMSDDSQAWLDTVLPLDDVGSNDVELAGRFAEFVARLHTAAGELTGARPLAEWISGLTDAVAALTRVGPDDAWQQGQLQREFASVVEQAGSRADSLLRLPDARALLDGHFAGRPTRANFRTGTLTVCTMVPMRSVPHRVICLVGLDDGVFPRMDQPDGDDVLARRPLTGERDIRSEDRQLLLDAVCAATQTLVITYTGADVHTGERRPPSVPLAELLDALDATTPAPVRSRVVTEHPLQPFDIRNVKPGELVPDGPFTFDPTVLVAAEATAGQRRAVSSFLSEALPAPPPDDVTLPELVDFFRNPVKGFFTALDYTLPWEVDGVDDAIPVALTALQEWGVGERMLQDMLHGIHPETSTHIQWRRGVLPPAELGKRTACRLRDCARELAVEALRYRDGDPESFDVAVDLGRGRQLSGTVSGIYGDRLVSVTYSKLDCRHLLRAWLPLVALAAQFPGRSWSASCIGRGLHTELIVHRILTTPTDPAAVLADLVALYDAGRREPLPLPVRTSHAWAEARAHRADPQTAALRRWRSNDHFHGEDQEPACQQAWGEQAPLEAILGVPRPGEQVAGETTRLGALAVRLWTPLLEAERTVD